MAKRNIVAVASIAVVFGILAVVLCFAGYAHRIKVRDVSISSDGSCNYQTSPAFAIGIVAAIFLLIEQIIVSVGTGCFCCRGAGTACPSTCGSITSFILFVLSWVTFVIAFMGLIATALLNNSSYLATNYTGQMSISNNTVYDCYLTKDTLFIGDAIWCIITIVLGIISFVISKVSSSRNNANQQQSTGYAHFATDRGFAVGQPSTEMQSKGQHLGV